MHQTSTTPIFSSCAVARVLLVFINLARCVCSRSCSAHPYLVCSYECVCCTLMRSVQRRRERESIAQQPPTNSRTYIHTIHIHMYIHNTYMHEQYIHTTSKEAEGFCARMHKTQKKARCKTRMRFMRIVHSSISLWTSTDENTNTCIYV